MPPPPGCEADVTEAVVGAAEVDFGAVDAVVDAEPVAERVCDELFGDDEGAVERIAGSVADEVVEAVADGDVDGVVDGDAAPVLAVVRAGRLVVALAAGAFGEDADEVVAPPDLLEPPPNVGTK